MEKSERVFNIPEFEYFDMGGHYSGSKRGTKLDDFCFRVIPKEEITVQIWHDAKCFELSVLKAESVFEKTREGYRAFCDYIEEQYKEWLKDHVPLSNEYGYFGNEE